LLDRSLLVFLRGNKGNLGVVQPLPRFVEPAPICDIRSRSA
jgi:hypothetical protein